MELIGVNEMTIEAIAEICHEANRAYCNGLGDLSQDQWQYAPQWQKDSAIKGVEFCLNNPNAPTSSNHDSWLEEKRKTGWKYGPVIDANKKEHPCFVPYDELPIELKLLDSLFKNIVSTFIVA